MRYAGGFVLWLALTRSLDPRILGLGAVVTIAVVVVSRRLVPRARPVHSPVWARVAGAAAFVAILAVRFVSSTLLTSAMILTGRETSRVVVLPVQLRDPGRRFLLLNAITLTPSTISLHLEGDLLYVHWLLPRGREVDASRVKDAIERPLRFGEGGDDARGD